MPLACTALAPGRSSGQATSILAQNTAGVLVVHLHHALLLLRGICLPQRAMRFRSFSGIRNDCDTAKRKTRCDYFAVDQVSSGVDGKQALSRVVFALLRAPDSIILLVHRSVEKASSLSYTTYLQQASSAASAYPCQKCRSDGYRDDRCGTCRSDLLYVSRTYRDLNVGLLRRLVGVAFRGHCRQCCVGDAAPSTPSPAAAAPPQLTKEERDAMHRQ